MTSRRCAVVAAVVGLVLATVLGFPPPAGATSWAADDGVLPYSAGALYKTPLPADAPLSPDDDSFVRWEKQHEPFDFWKIRTTSAGFAMNYAQGVCSDPLFTIAPNGRVPSGQDFLKTEGFHAPPAMFEHMVQNGDSPIVVQDRCGTSARPDGFTVWAANVLYDGTTVLRSGQGGRITAGSFDWRTNGLDSGVPFSDAAPGQNAVSRGVIPDTMVIRDDLLRRAMADRGTGVVAGGAVPGTLGHVLAVFFQRTNSAAGYQPPMVGAESGKAGCGGRAHAGICAEGQYVRIDPHKALPSSCTGAARVVARTLQAYGGYLANNSGSGSGIKAEAGTTLLGPDALQKCMTLGDLQILQKGYTPKSPVRPVPRPGSPPLAPAVIVLLVVLVAAVVLLSWRRRRRGRGGGGPPSPGVPAGTEAPATDLGEWRRTPG